MGRSESGGKGRARLRAEREEGTGLQHWASAWETRALAWARAGAAAERGDARGDAGLLALDWAAREEGKEKGCWAAALRGLS